MSDKRIWFITGAGRGMGVEFVKAALAAGHAVVATGRDAERVATPFGPSDDLMAVKLDVTSREDAAAAVQTAIDRFGRIDVLVNNAASFYAGFFEELTTEQVDQQLTTSLIGPMNVTRAVLAGDAQTALRTHPYDLFLRRPRRRLRFRDGLCGVEVCRRRLDGIASVRSGGLRHQHHHREPAASSARSC